MKKTLIAAAALVAMVACNKNIIEISNPEAGYGYINLGVSADTEMVVTKADGETATVDTDNYQVTLFNSEGASQGTKIYSDIKENGWKVAAGSYTLKVENMLETNIYNAGVNGGKGQAYIAGASEQEFEVMAGVVTKQTVNCSVKNSKVSFQYDAKFAEVFSKTNTLKVVSGEKEFGLGMLNVDAEGYAQDNLEAAFFAPGSVTWTLSATKANDEVKTYTNNFTTEAAKWTIVKFSVGATTGTIKVTISVDGNITEQIINAELDPMSDGVTINDGTSSPETV